MKVFFKYLRIGKALKMPINHREIKITIILEISWLIQRNVCRSSEYYTRC